MANRSDYTYHINSKHGLPVLVIEDLNLGRMSVTNNSEAIVTKIADEVGLTVYEMPIVYRDSEGIYDGMADKGATFCMIGATDEESAVAAAVKSVPKE